ncbi:MAG: hypothetical protein WC375_12180, partial [Methanomassiliicoccales archaeon]
DVLEPEFLDEQISFMKANPDIAALGCNGPMIDLEGREMGRPVLPRKEETVTWFRTPAELALQYSDGHLLYPSMIYRSDSIRPEMVHEEFGKVGDSRLLFDVLSNGAIVHRDLMLYRYRVHGNQDSALLPESDYRLKDRFLIEVSKDDHALGRRVARNVYKLQTRRYFERAASALMKRGFSEMRASLGKDRPDKFSFIGALSIVPFALRRWMHGDRRS